MKTIADFFTSETFGFLLKLFSGLAAAAFGMLGIGSKTREDDGRLTRNGKIALTGIIVAGLLAVGTSVYEFTTSQAKGKAAQAQSEQLILSVRRGIYPLKGITASFDIAFDQDIAGLAEYKKIVRAAISDHPNCEAAKTFYCYGQGSQGPYAFRIQSTSPLFPKKQSLVRIVIENLGVNISMYKRLTSAETKAVSAYKYLGSFPIDLWLHEPEQWAVEYDYPRDSLSVHVDALDVPDTFPIQSQVYSLVDFAPGLVTAGAHFSDDAECYALQDRGYEMHWCGDHVIEPLSRHLVLYDLQIRFKYPKALFFPYLPTLTCTSKRYTALFILKDIDSANAIGAPEKEVADTDREKACAAITNPDRTPSP